MSCSYADGLSPYEHKGKLGQTEIFDTPEEVDNKVELLTKWISQESSHTVFHTGAGISTSAGIPDFRGPKGVWTLEKKGLKPDMNVSWDDAVPTKSHMAISKLFDMNLAHFLISQNIDGLHMRSGISRSKIAELHGNMFVDACQTCRRMFVRDSPAPTVGQKFVGKSCPATRINNVSPTGDTKRGNCRGKLIDFVLDWEHELPESDRILSDAHSTLAELSIVIGSTLQIIPAGNMPTYTKKYQGAGKGHGRLVIINLQPTKHDKKADLLIRAFADTVMTKLFERLGVQIPCYDARNDPVKSLTSLPQATVDTPLIEWTQNSRKSKEIQKLASIVEQEWKDKRKAGKINSHISTSGSKISDSISSPEIVSKRNKSSELQEQKMPNKKENIPFKLNRDNEGLCCKKVKLSDDTTQNLASEINAQV
jgi:mono-ADP-ribosyltransferase sirtuin 6